MSVCSYIPISPEKEPERWESSQQVERQLLHDPEWSMLSLTDMALTGSSLEVLQDSVPFRRHACRRSMKCCGVCTRQCRRRCIQDSLQRLYVWRKLFASTPEEELEQLPLGVRMIVKQEFNTSEDLAWAVGEIISAKTNTEVQEYMERLQLGRSFNPNKRDYSPQPVLDEATGKRVVDPKTGVIKFRLWPESGLCPFCLPSNTIDKRLIVGKEKIDD